MYNWQYNNWPNFEYDIAQLSELAMVFSQSLGEMSGSVKGLTPQAQQAALIRLMLEEALKTSAIEGEVLNREDVRSSIENNLGLHPQLKHIHDRRAKAISAVMIEVRNNYNSKLSESLIKSWHKLLFDNANTINPGQYRRSTAPMQIVSGAIGKETIHFEAPPSSEVSHEMKRFVNWYNQYEVKGNITHTLAKTAITHVYFESIHPFEDGNGRIGRALAEKCLSESLGSPILLSLSSVLEHNRTHYYQSLKDAQSSLDITKWLIYFSEVIIEAQKSAIEAVHFSLKRTQFFDTFKSQLSEREQKVLNKMLEAGTAGFEGGMTAKKYVSITKVSKATATRDLQHLAELGVFAAQGEGRSVHYTIMLMPK